MAYIDYYQLDKNNKVVKEHTSRACFYEITQNNTNLHKDCQYLLFDFGKKQTVSNEEARQYFLFLKSIPEFKELMPKSCKAMAETGYFQIDLHKFNGTKVFTILTLIRAVVEDPKIVRAVLQFDRKFKYSLSNFSILKMCGSVYMTNCGHWITNRVDKLKLQEMFNDKYYWNEPTSCIETGLGRNIHYTFNHSVNGFAVKNPIYQKDIDKVREEKDKPKKAAVRQKMYDTTYLQLGF